MLAWIRSGRREAALVILGALGFAAAFSYPILAYPSNIGVVWDWPEFLIRNWVAYYSVRHFHQLPLWNPYECGGMPLLAHPSSQILTPLFALPLVFGPFAGLNLQIPAHLAIAWSGGWVLGRVLGMDPFGRLACASIFPASSWFYLHIGVGHLNFLPAAYLPWIAAAAIAGARGSAAAWIAAGLLLAIMFGEGGVYQTTQAVILSGLIVLAIGAVRRSWRPVGGFLLMLAFAAGFAAVKLLPSIAMMRLHPRAVQDLEYSPISALLQGLFAHYQYYDRARVEAWGFWEVGAYLGPAAAALALLGIAGYWRRSLPWLLAAGLFFLLAVGAPRAWFPWALIHYLPVISRERVPERFLILLVLCVGVMAGWGADFLSLRWRRAGAIAAAVLIAAAVADAWTVSRPNMDAPVAGQLPEVDASSHFVQSYDDPWNMLGVAMSNRGALHCNEELDFHEAANMRVTAYNQPGYRGEYYLLGPGTPVLRRWTPNALSYDVTAPAANLLVINQNYDSNWKLAGGQGEVVPHRGLLAVRIGPGAQRLTLVYRSYPFISGAAISLLTVLGAAAWCARRLEKRMPP